jgi:hypothetical protein
VYEMRLRGARVQTCGRATSTKADPSARPRSSSASDTASPPAARTSARPAAARAARARASAPTVHSAKTRAVLRGGALAPCKDAQGERERGGARCERERSAQVGLPRG